MQKDAVKYLSNLLAAKPQASSLQPLIQAPVTKYVDELKTGKLQLKQLQNVVNPQLPESRNLTDEEHKEFMQKLLEEKRKLREERKLRRKRQQEEEKKKTEGKLKRLQEEHKMKEQEKKQQLKNRLSNMQQMSRKRRSQADLANKALRQLKQSQTLHDKLLNRFLMSEANALEQTKKKLAEIRDLHKPLSKKQFQQHLQRLDKIKESIGSPRKLNIRSSSMGNIYRSAWYKQAEEEDFVKMYAEKQAEEAKKAKEFHQKLQKYSTYVKTNFKPQIDPKKSEQLKESIGHIIHKAPVLTGEQPKIKGKQYLKYSKEHIDREASKNKTQEKLKQKPNHDYLKEVKEQNKKRKDIFVGILEGQTKNKQKSDVVLGHVEKMQEEMRRRQKLDRITNKVMDDRLDDMYVNSIKAKLSLLQ